MNKSRLLGAVCACLFPYLSSAATIGPGDFGPNATIEDYENLDLPEALRLPVEIGGDIYGPPSGIYWALTYTDSVYCPSGYCLETRGTAQRITIDLGSMVNRAGIYLNAQSGPHFFDAFDGDGNLIETDNTGVLTPGGRFYGIEATGNEIARVELTVYSTLAAHIDNFTKEITPVPIPASVWLFGSGLLGLVGMARRKKA